MKKDTDNRNGKRRSTFAVLFYINRTKVRKDGMCQLLCKVSMRNGHRLEQKCPSIQTIGILKKDGLTDAARMPSP